MSEGVHLQRATVADIPRLWALRTRSVRQLCAGHYAPDVVAAWSAWPAPASYTTLLEQGGGIMACDATAGLLGYGVMNLADNALDALFVAPEAGGQGIGQQLMAALLGMADPSREVTLSASLNAQHFYQRAGFIAEGEEDFAHPSGVILASIRMRRPAVAPAR